MAHTSRFVIEKLEVADAPEVARFLAASIEGGSPSAEWLLWLADASIVARIDEVILGWKLTVNGELQGIHLATPFRLAGASTDEMELVSHNFYVNKAWRGMPGLALFRAFLAEKKRFRVIATTANAQSGALWKALGGTPVPGAELEAYQLRIGLPFAEEAIVRRSPWLKKIIPSTRSRVSKLKSAKEFLQARVEEINHWPDPAEDEVAFTPEILQWWLSCPASGPELIRFQVKSEPVWALLELGVRGHRGQIDSVAVRYLWGPGFDHSPEEAIAALTKYCLRSGSIVSFGGSMIRSKAPGSLRTRVLDSPRRWQFPRSKADVAHTRWNGLDSI